MNTSNKKQIELHKSFFFGGNATFTMDNGSGEHYTFRIRQSKDNPRFAGPSPHFVMLLTGTDNEYSFTYLGKVDVFGNFSLTHASKMKMDSTPVKVFCWVMKHVMGDNLIPAHYNLRHSGKCGCCGRKLTHPESLTRGIGPECWGRIVGGR